MNFINDHKIIIMLIGGLLLIVVYSMLSVFINKLNNVIHGKTTILAWIPPFNVYLLGKLVVNKIIGLLLVILLIFGIIISFKIPGLEMFSSLLVQGYTISYLIAYCMVILMLVLIGKSKLNKIIREGKGNDEVSRFVAKKYDDKEPVITEELKPKEIQEGIKDEYDYKHTSLSDLNNLNNNSDKNNP